MAGGGGAEGVDEQLYSRQLYVLGREAQERLQSCKVLLGGRLGGLAAEVAKNLMLAGVHSLTLADDGACRAADLADNCFVVPGDLGRPRAQVLLERLAELNSYVALDARPAAELTLDADGYGRYDVVVLVDADQAVLASVGAFCHSRQPKSIALCCAGAFGLYGYVFNDFGPAFTVLDADGEAPKAGIVVQISREADDGPGPSRLIVSTADDAHHGLSDGDWVTFSGVRGLEFLNDGEPREVRVEQVVGTDGKKVDGVAFSVADDGNEAGGAYSGAGNFMQVKRPTQVHFKPFAEALEDPAFVTNDWEDLDMPRKLHAYLRALWAFQEERGGAAPRPGVAEDAARVAELTKERLARRGVAEADAFADDVAAKLALGAAGRIAPMAAFLGGIVAQEALKACSGKFTPIEQWLHFAAPQCLPEPMPSAPGAFPSLEQLDACTAPADPLGRYAGQAAVFGWEFQRRLGQLKCFLVGAGALGCESLKNLALMGVSCTPGEGELVVTDMDGIEVSNLNRQFLFRARHVGKMKSVVAAEASRAMNPDFQVRAMETKVAPDTEDTFNDAFWAGLDIVVNALDNVVARKYVDSKCLFHQKPLLESGTLGTKANTLPIVPHLTESYSSDPVKDEQGGDIPACTLHAYPNLIEHTLAWARDAVFERYFHLDPVEGQEYLKHVHAGTLETKLLPELDRQPSTKVARLRTARAVLAGPAPEDHAEKLFPYSVDLSGGVDLGTCVRLARLRFEELFVNKIEQLLLAHPLDKVTDDQGTKFWSGKRRPPRRTAFDANDELHMLFLQAATHLFTKIYAVSPGLPADRSEWPACIKGILAKQPPVEPFKADTSVVVPENDEQAKALQKEQEKRAEQEAASADERCADELARLAACTALPRALHPQVFEKDDAENGHMDLIYAAASIRARSYEIPSVDQLQATMIVGRIIPAIATTTAMTTGAVALELYKVFLDKPLEAYRAANMNLAVNSFAAFEPTPCAKRYFGKRKHVRAGEFDKCLPVTIWTVVHLVGDMTVQEVLEHFQETYGFEVTTLSTSGDVSLYNDMFGQEDRLDQRVSDLFRSVMGTEPPAYITLDIDGDFEEDDDDDDDDDDDEEENEDEDPPVPAVRLEWGAHC